MKIARAESGSHILFQQAIGFSVPFLLDEAERIEFVL